jgi:hypothetical protein
MTNTLLTSALAVLAVGQTLAIWSLSKKIGAVGRANERLAHLAEALALLTDTTEAGLANVALELERAGGRRAARSTARVAGKRITSAVRRGRSIEEVAANEGLSESEVRLHLHMVADDATKGALDGPLRV